MGSWDAPTGRGSPSQAIVKTPSRHRVTRMAEGAGTSFTTFEVLDQLQPLRRIFEVLSLYLRDGYQGSVFEEQAKGVRGFKLGDRLPHSASHDPIEHVRPIGNPGKAPR